MGHLRGATVMRQLGPRAYECGFCLVFANTRLSSLGQDVRLITGNDDAGFILAPNSSQPFEA